MDILFNSTGEVREHVNFLYESADFRVLFPDIEIATEEVVEVVGEGIYKKVLDAYHTTDRESVYGKLVTYFQRPISLLAYLSYASNSDISHEDSGRKVKIDKESESMPWEWQIARDDAALLRKATKAIDRLINELDKHIEQLPEWKESEQRKGLDRLFVKNAREFDDVVPIDRSRVFYIRVLSFVKREDAGLSAFIGSERFLEIKEQLVNGNLSEDNTRVVDLCRKIIPLRVMVTALRRFPVKVLPDSVVHRFSAERHTIDASIPATLEMIKRVENSYLEEALEAESELQCYISSINPDPDTYQKKDTDYSREKFFST